MSLVAIVTTCAGCVVRTDTSEVYLGPVLLRATDACHGHAGVVQSVHVGVAGEIGSQVGLAVGLAERVAATPVVDASLASQCDEWDMVGGIPGSITADHWTASLLYARRRAARPPEFVSRRLAGAQAAVGNELSALSVGVVSRTEMRPGDDALYSFRYDASRPMDARFRKRSYGPGGTFPLSDDAEEE
jgi:hypothetical protein